MKNLLGISLVALFAAVPMMAMADPVAGSPATYTTQPTGDARDAVVGGQPLYQLAQSHTSDANAASAGYVKGAYNAAIKGINRVHDEAVAAQSAASAVASTISGYGNIVTHNASEFASSAQGAKADTALQSAGTGLTASGTTVSLSAATQSSLAKADAALNASSALNGAKLTDSTVTKAKLDSTVQASLDKADAALNASSALNGAKLSSGTVAAAALATSAVETAKINAKAVTAEKIADNTITAAQIATSGVGSDEIAANAVTTGKIANGTILVEDMSASAIKTATNTATYSGTLLTNQGYVDEKVATATANAATQAGVKATVNAATGSVSGVSLGVNFGTITTNTSSLKVSVPTKASYNIMQTWGSDSATAATYNLGTNADASVSGTATTTIGATTATGNITGIDVSVTSYTAQ